MHIVILDKVTLDEAQIKRLEALGTVTTHDTNPSSDKEIVARLKDADIVILGWTYLKAATLAKLPHLKLISIWATDYSYVDIGAAAKNDTIVTNVPGYAGTATAELTIALMLALLRNILPAYAAVRTGMYDRTPFMGNELRGRTLGVIGVGNTGSRVITLAKAFGMRVLAHAKDNSQRRSDLFEVDFVDLPTLLRESDIVSVQVQFNKDTHHLINAETLALMKPTALLVSTSKESIVDQTALREALVEGRLAGAALDEITFPDEALTTLPNVIVTPSIGFYTQESLTRKGDICVTNVENYVNGDPTNAVSA